MLGDAASRDVGCMSFPRCGNWALERWGASALSFGGTGRAGRAVLNGEPSSLCICFAEECTISGSAILNSTDTSDQEVE